jgi:hypothetical protein
MTRHRGGAENGISDIAAPMNSLVGVFLSDEPPDGSKAPRALDYKSIRRSKDSIAPALKQVFFIGDGRRSGGGLRRYLVPRGATRLFLGVMDGYEWNNNSGSFTAIVAIERDQVDSAVFRVDSQHHVSQVGLPAGQDALHAGPACGGREGAGRVPRGAARFVGMEHQRAGGRRFRDDPPCGRDGVPERRSVRGTSGYWECGGPGIPRAGQAGWRTDFEGDRGPNLLFRQSPQRGPVS